MLWGVALMAWAAVHGADAVADSGPARARASVPDGANRVLLAGGEEEGSLEPCGCGPRPLGGAARVARYVRAAGQRDAVVLVDAGGWLAGAQRIDGSFSPDVSALNAGWRDLRFLGTLDALPDGVVSANARRLDGGPVPPAVLERTLGGVRVAITGVTWGTRVPEGWALDDPATAVAVALDGVEADVVVVLAFELGEHLRSVANVPGVDLIVDGAGHRERWPAVAWEQATLARVVAGTEYLTELRIQSTAGGPLDIETRHVELDPSIGEDRAVRRYVRAVANEVADAYDGAYVGSGGSANRRASVLGFDEVAPAAPSQ